MKDKKNKENEIAKIMLTLSTKMSKEEIKKWNNYRLRLWSLCDRLHDISRMPSVADSYGKHMRELVATALELPTILKSGEVSY